MNQFGMRKRGAVGVHRVVPGNADGPMTCSLESLDGSFVAEESLVLLGLDSSLGDQGKEGASTCLTGAGIVFLGGLVKYDFGVP